MEEGKPSVGTSPSAESPTGRQFVVPSPVPTRRSRTYSQSERARAEPTQHGKIQSFCRQKGHGFITPRDGGELVFVHISDIEGELVPMEGDEVSYKRCAMPPKFEKFCAVQVNITHAKEGITHKRWDGKVSLE